MDITSEERELLRELAEDVAEIAALDVHEKTRTLWKQLNGLAPQRPMVMIDQVPWHEMDVDGELTLGCSNDFPRSLEWRLRETLYRWRHMPADMVVEPFIDVPKVIANSGFGITKKEDTAVSDPSNSVVGHKYFDQLATEEDLEKIKTPVVSLEEELTAEREAAAHDIFDGILGVRMTGVTATFALWDRIVEWHGVEGSIIDLVDRPEFIHKMMRRFTDAHLGLLDQLESQGLLACDIPTIHCSGAYSDELPAAGFKSSKPRAKDTWTSGMAQIFATVSPAMHDEFEIEYAIPWYDRFGLTYYGCCEPLHHKIGIISRIPRVRKISMSPWADIPKAAPQMAGRYVISRKPSPAFLATRGWEPEAVRRDLEETHNTAANDGCAVEFILKDISTVKYEPQRLWDWADIARSVVVS